MLKKVFTTSQIKKITGASRHESIHVPFYYAPPFLDILREQIKSLLSSSGGRPTIKGAEIVRKVRFSKKNWDELNRIAENFSKSGVSVSPAQVVSTIVEEIISSSRLIKKREKISRRVKVRSVGKVKAKGKERKTNREKEAEVIA
ncbi:hypothetical protein BMS3Abin10_00265 [bacterium BMS3Abin10]|nr:hypothetical protein BMS3Abin10_00265 [bacterium BMS3Abin10]GBE38629.1 hypothetical protein BMS3Bbin08_01236 [bacterium BMS3Bbin08]